MVLILFFICIILNFNQILYAKSFEEQYIYIKNKIPLSFSSEINTLRKIEAVDVLYHTIFETSTGADFGKDRVVFKIYVCSCKTSLHGRTLFFDYRTDYNYNLNKSLSRGVK